jgi:hypothetical protein
MPVAGAIGKSHFILYILAARAGGAGMEGKFHSCHESGKNPAGNRGRLIVA